MGVSLTFLGLAASVAYAGNDTTLTTETVYVEAPFSTDGDGQLDRIYVQIDRPTGQANVPSIFLITPYAFGGNDVPNHGVDASRLPQDVALDDSQGIAEALRLKEKVAEENRLIAFRQAALARGYATVSAHSIGTGYSTGCPTVGDEKETLAAKAVIDWLNGRGRAYGTNGQLVTASWASGNVGMTGVSYNGTLPNMVATTGVDGLKAIIPVAAITNWYDYYRANGLVVGPGGYIGEDADVLGKFIVRSGACAAEMSRISTVMGREHGDFTPFWQERDYLAHAGAVRAAVFIMHGQADWNVKQRHAIQWWDSLKGQVPLKMWLHRGGHGMPSRSTTEEKTWAWFDRYVKGIANGIENEPAVDVESGAGTWTTQADWPNEATTIRRLYLNADHALAPAPALASRKSFTDAGKTTRLEALLGDPGQDTGKRLTFATAPLATPRLLSGTPRVTLDLAVMNRRAANLTVAVVDYTNGNGRIVTRGWADPQNHADLTQGEQLVPGQRYRVAFDLEPKQYTFARGSRIVLVVASTDYDYTIRPDAGTVVDLALGGESFVDLGLSAE